MFMFDSRVVLKSDGASPQIVVVILKSSNSGILQTLSKIN